MAKRHALVVLTFLLSMLLYVDRVVISTAKLPIATQLNLSDTRFGWVLSAFALGYALFQTPSGTLADRYGPRLMMTAVVMSWSIFTALTGVTQGFVALLICRLLFGICEAGAYPTCARAFYSWLPVSERGFAQGVNFSGSRLGAAFTLPLIAWLVSRTGWRASFLLLGALGIVFAAVWWFLVRDSPENHPRISTAERDLIIRERSDGKSALQVRSKLSLAWPSRNLWIAMAQYFASNFTFFFCLTWLFPYLQKTYHLDAVHAGLFSSGPLIAGACGNWTGGLLVDTMYRRSSSRRSRQIPAMIGFLIAAGGLVASLFATSIGYKVIGLAMATFGSDMTLPSSWAFCIDIGRGNAGQVAGTMNMAGNLGSFVTSIAFPYLLLATGSPTPFFLLGAFFNIVAAWMWIYARPNQPDDAVKMDLIISHAQR